MIGYLRQVVRRRLSILVLSALFCIGWIVYSSYLTLHNDKACETMREVVLEEKKGMGVDEIQRVLDAYSAANGNIGLQASVIYPDETKWQGASGYANLEKKCCMTGEHHLYIGSMTKLFTSVLVMRMVEKGNFSLHDSVDRWINLPYAQAIPGETLVGQTGSIPGFSGIVMHNQDKRYTITILSNLSIIEQTELLKQVQHVVLKTLSDT